MDMVTDANVARGWGALRGKYCIRLKVSAVDRENAWELCGLAVHFEGTEVYDRYFTFVDEQRRTLVSAMLKLQFGSEYVEEFDVADSGTNVRLLMAARAERLRHNCCRRFAQRGFLVAEAVDAVGCMEVLRSWRPDVVVLRDDLLWGGSDGVLEGMRQNAELKKLPVVLITNQHPAHDNSIRRVSPAVACFAEPLVWEGLLNTVAYVASLRRPRR